MEKYFEIFVLNSNDLLFMKMKKEKTGILEIFRNRPIHIPDLEESLRVSAENGKLLKTTFLHMVCVQVVYDSH